MLPPNYNPTMLSDCRLMGFIPVSDADRARSFYVDTLGFEFVRDDGFAVTVRCCGNHLRLVRVESFTPAAYTVCGWETDDIVLEALALRKAGVPPQRYPYFNQDENRIWTAPNGDRVLWFKDPDGNTLSISQH